MSKIYILIIFTLALSPFTLISSNNSKMSADFDLHPNKPYSITNPLAFAVSITCYLSCPQVQNIFGKVEKGTLSINGKNVPSEGASVNVKHGDKFSINASGLASVTIINKGKDVVYAKCSFGAKALLEYNKYKRILENNISVFIENQSNNDQKFETLKFLD